MRSKLLALLLAVLLPLQSFGAISATSTWEIRTTGANTNGGGYDSAIAGGSDQTQQNAAVLSNTDFATSGIGVTTLTTVQGGLTSAMIGNAVHLNSGTNVTAGFYFITAVASGTSCTLDRAPDTGAGGIASGVGSVGGAVADIGFIAGFAVAGNQFYAQAGTYSITSSSSNVAAGVATLPAGSSAAQPTRLIGYNVSRTDYGTRPLFQASGAFSGAPTALINTSTNTAVFNVSIDAALKTSSRCLNLNGSGSWAYLCKCANATGCGVVGTGSNNRLLLCEVTGCTTVAPACRDAGGWYCVVHDNTVTGFDANSSNTTNVGCVAANNTGSSSDGFACTSATATQSYLNCTAYNNGGHGFNCNASAFAVTFINCIATNHTTAGKYGFSASATAGEHYLFNCAGYNNNAGNVNTTIAAGQQFSFIALTGSPFVATASNNFALNNASGAGAACRAAGIPSLTGTNGGLPFLSTSAYPDLGAAQSQLGLSPHNIGGGKSGGLIR